MKNVHKDMRFMQLVFMFFMFGLLERVNPSCESCRPFETCKDGICSGSSCDKQSRWYFTEPSGSISDGPGNYSANMKCTWLIDARNYNRPSSKAKIRIRVDSFVSECAWDHLYIWDGDSTNAPLLASLSGVFQESLNVFEVTTTSGMAYIHFYSDPAFTMSGFNISYEIEGCELDCSSRSSHGTCVALASNGGSRTCICDNGWTGSACDVPLGCPGSFSCQNGGTCVEETCKCAVGFKGPDCSVRGFDGIWDSVSVQIATSVPPPSASHATVLVNQSVYWIGGENFRKDTDLKTIYRLDMASLMFEPITSDSGSNPSGRFGHSAVAYNDSIYIYGGVVNGTSVVNELWQWESKHKLWILRKHDQNCKVNCAPFPSVGHTAHVVKHKMLVIFGYGGPENGFLNIVQEYDFTKRKWDVIQASGSFVYGTYGHVSVYDSKTGQIYIHGGYTPTSRQYVLSDRLILFDPEKAFFRKLQSSPFPRFLHSAVIMDREILIFGGNQHNESLVRSGVPAPCYSRDFYAYDIECDSWKQMKQASIPYSSVRLSRYGHSALVFKDRMYIFGGFQGVLLNDVVRYTPGECMFLAGRDDCLSSAKSGRKCAFSDRLRQCLEADNQLPGVEFSKCRRSADTEDPYCNQQLNCHDCLSGESKCQWCKDGNICSASPCKSDIGQISSLESCPRELTAFCSNYVGSCFNCISLTNNTCTWRRDEGHGGQCGPRYSAVPADVSAVCDAPCSSRTTCDTCSTQSLNCMWCSNEQKCIESNAYLATFPYGQCRDWQAMNKRCGQSRCESVKSCDACIQNPDCGWCEVLLKDGSSTGLGHCSAGSNHGPNEIESCPLEHWFFNGSCPLCTCNGHAVCVNTSDYCHCKDFTEGANCDRCVGGFYGDPRNGGNCSECLCPVSSNGCDPENGNCRCTTKGVIGRRCDRCDESNHYVGNDGVCFYELPLGYQFTFNLTKMEDLQFTAINFRVQPTEKDKDYDVKFTLLCTNVSSVNVSYRTSRMLHEEYLLTEVGCSLDNKIERVFTHDQLPFGQDNTTIYVYVHDFVTPAVIVISFAQHASLDLLHFFVVFACCFLSLLLLAAILWKVKQKYDLYRRRQHLIVQMEEMAKRPFACVMLEIPKTPEHLVNGTSRKKVTRSSRTCFVANEPLADGKHAIMTALICLPTGDGNYTAPGQAGLCIASTLVTYGSQLRRPSLDQKPDKPKSHKHAQDAAT